MSLLLDAATQTVKVLSMPDDPIAKQALKVAQDTLVVTRRAYLAAIVAAVVALLAFILTYIDVRQNTRQFHDFRRRAKFVVFHSQKLAMQGGSQVLTLDIKCENRGDRLTERFMFELLCPVQFMPKIPTDDSQYALVNGRSHLVRQVNWGSIMYPNAPTTRIAVMSFPIIKGLKTVKLLWRIYDVNGNYPEKKYGVLTVDLTHTPIDVA